MKKIAYLSPTSIRLFDENMKEFYLNYLSDNRPDKFPQTKPMAVGSAFDAYAKSFLHEHLFGKGKDPRFDLQTIFEAQVEQQNRDFAYTAGKHCFDQYKNSGALSDLMLELGKAVGEPRFELEIRGVIEGKREGVTLNVEDVVFLGKPDVFFINSQGAHVILDWKVNGYCSGYGVSPLAGYVRLRERTDTGWRNKGQHKNAQPMSHQGVVINCAGYLEDVSKEWAQQLSIYGWLCGQDIGADFIVAIDQLVCKPGGEYPHIRIAEHRTRVRKDFQWNTFVQAQKIWEIVHSDHIFREMSLEDSKAQCVALDGIKEAMKGDGSTADQWFASAMRN
jgi:PD-(D/E)XK nuclease superfamily